MDVNKKTYKGMKVEKNILNLIGKTPLINLKNIVAGFKGDFFSKFEAFNR